MKITVREFSDKYGIDYSTVYNATYLVKTKSASLVNRQYDEQELLNALRLTAKRRVDRLKSELKKAEIILSRVKM